MNLPEELDLLLDELIDEDTLSSDDDDVLRQIAAEYGLDYAVLRNELAERGGPELPYEAEDDDTGEIDSDMEDLSLFQALWAIVKVLGALVILLAAIVGSIWLIGWSLLELFRAIWALFG